jgi:predicted protein tyrosine phosphatase
MHGFQNWGYSSRSRSKITKKFRDLMKENRAICLPAH